MRCVPFYTYFPRFCGGIVLYNKVIIKKIAVHFSLKRFRPPRFENFSWAVCKGDPCGVNKW